MAKKLLILLSLNLMVILFSSCNRETQDPDFHIYLCFGQSNMEGQGTIESQDQAVDKRFLLMQSMDCPRVESDTLERIKGHWRSAIPPLCQCNTGLSPVDYFGKTMLEQLPEKVRLGVINVAVGGCDIRLFDKDLYQDYDSTYTEKWFTDKVAFYEGNPYQHLISLAKIAQKDGIIKGILLHQGETNTGDRQWPNYVEKIYKDLLKDLALEASAVPLLAGELVSVDSSCCASMNPIINTLPNVIATAHVISAENCTAQDRAHFDAEGYRVLGRRYGLKMLELMAE